MIVVKNKAAIQKMEEAGQRLITVFDSIKPLICSGTSAKELDSRIAQCLAEQGLVSKSKGYMGYRHVSCISVNDVVVHGVPYSSVVFRDGDLVKVDVCASYKGYCADMARCFFIGKPDPKIKHFVEVAKRSLDKGIACARAGRRLTDISAAIQHEIESHGFGVVRDFAGHGIGKRMHEEPEVLNYGKPGRGPILQSGMTLAIEPMITFGKHDVFIDDDGWTVKTADKSMAAHVEDTILITEGEPKILTRRICRDSYDEA